MPNNPQITNAVSQTNIKQPAKILQSIGQLCAQKINKNGAPGQQQDDATQ